MLVADSWFSDSKLMRYVADAHQGTLLVQGKSHSTFTLEDGQKVKGSDLVKPDKGAWQYSLHAPGCRYVRLRARSRTYGQVLLVVVDKPGDKPVYLQRPGDHGRDRVYVETLLDERGLRIL